MTTTTQAKPRTARQAAACAHLAQTARTAAREALSHPQTDDERRHALDPIADEIGRHSTAWFGPHITISFFAKRSHQPFCIRPDNSEASRVFGGRGG